MKNFLSIKILLLILLSQNNLFSQENNSSNKHVEFPGGSSEFIQFIKNNFHFPEESRKLYSNGKIDVLTEIDKFGNMKLLNKNQTNDSLFNLTIESLIDKMPKWNPAKKNDSTINIVANLPLNFSLLTTPDKKNISFTNDFVEFKHFKSASITYNKKIVRIDGKLRGANIVIIHEDEDFDLDQKLYELQDKFENAKMEITEKRGIVLNEISAEVTVGQLCFNPVARSLVGDMEIKYYKVEKDSEFYSICISEFAEDTEKNFKQNATVMSTIKFK